MKSDYLVCYDIADEKRLAKVYQFMKGRGVHLQYSVFFCRLTWPALLQLKEALACIINEEEDDIRIYSLPSGYKVTVLGCGDRVPEGVEVYV